MIRRFGARALLALALLAVVGVSPLVAQAKPAAAPAAPTAAAKAQAPVFLTSCGQSPGAVTVGVFLRRLQIDYDLKETGTVKDLAAKPYKTLIIVTGSSLKGMGGAGVSIDDELSARGRADRRSEEARHHGHRRARRGDGAPRQERRAGRQLRRDVDRRRLPEGADAASSARTATRTAGSRRSRRSSASRSCSTRRTSS